MDCRIALEILDCHGTGLSGLPEGDLAAASAHLAECGRCRAIVQNRRRLDRKIGRALRAVKVPRGAQERLIAQLAALESAAGRPSDASGVEVNGGSPANVAGEEWVPGAARVQGRRLWRGLVPVAACLVVAAVGFFGVVWLMTPRWSVDEIRQQLSRIDFDSLDALQDFSGAKAASRLPDDPGWHKLEWRSGQVPKAFPDDSSRNQFAVYGFVAPGRQRHPIHGLLAVVLRRRMRAPPADQTFSSAPSTGYLAARIGESVSVAWTDGDLVYVCLVEGGEDSLATLRQILGASAA